MSAKSISAEQNANLYHQFASRFPDNRSQPFLEHDRGITTFADIEEGSALISSVLKSCDLSKGERILVQVDKSPEAVLLYLACLRAGAVFIPLNTAYTMREVQYFIDDARPTIIVCDPSRKTVIVNLCSGLNNVSVLTLSATGTGSLCKKMSESEPDYIIEICDKDDLAAILYTSGTTGRSKGAMLSHDNLASNAIVLQKYWGWEPGDVLLHSLPIYHVHGLFVALHCALLNASKVIFHKSFNTKAIIRDLPASTVMMGVPTFYTRLLDDENFNRQACKNIRLFIAGSAPLLPETFSLFEQKTGHILLERYGMSEAGMITSNPYEGERIAGTVGFALPGVLTRVADKSGNELPRGEVGVLEIYGPNVFAGYWEMPDKTAEEFREDGFFITGDMAFMDEAGRISIVGRSKDLVISGGFNVYPKEIEAIIDELPGVKESAVIGVAHPDFGEAVTAVIILDGSKEITVETMRSHLDDHLAKFKQPKKIIFADELPRNAMGKVQKKLLREAHANIYMVT